MKILEWFKLPQTMGINNLDDPAVTMLHAKIAQSKLFLRRLYIDFYKQLEINGYDVVKKYGIPAPFPLAIGDKPLAHFLLRVNRRLILLSKSLFSYQIAVIAKPRPTLEHLLEDAHQGKNKKLNTGPAAEV